MEYFSSAERCKANLHGDTEKLEIRLSGFVSYAFTLWFQGKLGSKWKCSVFLFPVIKLHHLIIVQSIPVGDMNAKAFFEYKSKRSSNNTFLKWKEYCRKPKTNKQRLHNKVTRPHTWLLHLSNKISFKSTSGHFE